MVKEIKNLQKLGKFKMFIFSIFIVVHFTGVFYCKFLIAKRIAKAGEHNTRTYEQGCKNMSSE